MKVKRIVIEFEEPVDGEMFTADGWLEDGSEVYVMCSDYHGRDADFKYADVRFECEDKE